MNALLIVSIQFHGYWHIGSGYGGGARCDDLMRKNRDGLPLLPGRTIHGHLREATQTLEDMQRVGVDEGTTDRLFGETTESSARRRQQGSAVPPLKVDDANECAPGRLIVDNGVLSDPEAAWLRAHGDERKRLYRILRNTAIDDDGVAKENTLRAVEVCVPLALYAPVQLDGKGDAAKDIKTLRTACLLIRRIGMGRHRGLGRCSVELHEEPYPTAILVAIGAAPAVPTGGETL